MLLLREDTKEEEAILQIKEVSEYMVDTILEMDTTIMSEIEYLNILPDIEKMDQEMDDSSFLKGSFVEKSGGARQHRRIESLDASKIEEAKGGI